ncbi:MAG: 2'-5' RNA ligase family protein [Prosthecobacter sp.]
MKRAIHLIPDTSQHPEIEMLRQRFDWLHPHIRAHITLVFPFELPVSDADLVHHCQTVANEHQVFPVCLLPPERSADDHCWLPVEPHASLTHLAERLHSGPLASLASTRRVFIPHITLARPPLAPATPAEIAVQWPAFACPIRLPVDSITLEGIHPDHSSEVLECFPLR